MGEMMNETEYPISHAFRPGLADARRCDFPGCGARAESPNHNGWAAREIEYPTSICPDVKAGKAHAAHKIAGTWRDHCSGIGGTAREIDEAIAENATRAPGGPGVPADANPHDGKTLEELAVIMESDEFLRPHHKGDFACPGRAAGGSGSRPVCAMKFRKRPVVVEAIRWTGSNYADVALFAEGQFIEIAERDRGVDPEMTAKVFDYLHSAWIPLRIGDWIIRGVQGEYYPCKADVFEATYESWDR